MKNINLFNLLFFDSTNGAYSSWRFVALFIIFILLLFLLFYNYKKLNLINRDIIAKYSTLESGYEQYSLYFLYLGISLPLIQFVISYFDIRKRDSIDVNLLIGFSLIIIYYLSHKVPFVYRNIRKLFVLLFIVYYSLTVYRVIVKPDYIAVYFNFFILYVLSYSVFRSINKYWLFVFFNLGLTVLLFYLGIITKLYFVIMMYTTFLIAVLNHLKYISNLRTKDNFIFVDNIVNKGASLVIAVNLKGEVIYCSDTIIPILGYTPEEVKGLNFWKLTKDAEFTTIDYEINSNLYIRKLQCKNGSFKYIQWKDSKYSDEIYLGIGQDVTEQIEVQYQYQKLVQSASDIIYETDSKGLFTFVNPFAEKLLGYKKEEIIGKHFISFIVDDYTEQIFNYYINIPQNLTDVPCIEFPIIKNDGEHLWVSQKVTLNRNTEGKITGYVAIARDITAYKKIEIEEQNRKDKLHTYNSIVNNLVRKQYQQETFLEKINYILRSTSIGSKIDRISYWNYNIENIECISLYELASNSFSGNFTSYKSESPIYFEALEKDNIIIASDVYETDSTKEFVEDYFPENKIKSMLDVPVLVNGQLHSILCFETTKQIKNWDNEDINFARSISEVVALALESEKSKSIDVQLAKKTKVLSALAACTEIILKSSNINEVFDEIFSIIGNATNVDRVSYFKNDVLNKEMSIEYEWVPQNIMPQINNPELKRMKHSENEIFISKLSNNKVFQSNIHDISNEQIKIRLQEQQIKTILIFPIFVKGQFHATIGFDVCSSDREWTNDEIEVLQILANNLATTIERIENETLIQESEERFKLLANNIPGTVYLSNFDDNWSKIYLNEEIETLTGYPKEFFLQQKISLINLVHPDDINDVFKTTKECIEKRKPFHISYRIKRKTGEYIWVEEYGDAIIKNGSVEYIEGILLDITQKKQIEAEIKARELAEASNKTKSEFLANMSHEIRTPLNAIVGFTDLLKNTKLDQEQLDYVSTVNQSADILLNVVNDILDFSKIETGKLELEIQKTDICELVHQISDILRFDAIQKNIELNLNIDEKIPKNIFLDAFRLKQVLLNLVSNAIKFTSKGKVEISLDLLEKLDNEIIIKFNVEDTGIGIKKDNIKKIFEPFSQEDTSTTRKYGGTGLGLAISNNLLKLMGSKLELISDYKKGSNFYFELKLGYDSENASAKAINLNDIIVEYEDLTLKTKNLQQLEKKILIVEDNKINMMLTRTLIKKMLPKATIFEAENGKHGIEKFINDSPDLILLDIQMPVLNGYETAIEIRKTNLNIPIIALTAGTIKGEKEKCIESGMNDYLSKPIDKDIFENILLKWL